MRYRLPKLGAHAYTAWWALHAWAGVIASLVAYVMFFFGAWTLFHRELHSWQETRGEAPTFAQVDSILDTALASGAISPESVRVYLPGPKSATFSLSYTTPAGSQRFDFIEPSGLVEPRSIVSDFFYNMHYLQPPSAPGWLYVLAGLVAGLLLLVIVTGVFIHLQHLVSQLHQFRPRKSLQVFWSDAHKVLGMFGLPFVAIFAFTGAWMGLDALLSPALEHYVFRGDTKGAARAQFGPQAPRIEPTNVPAARLPLADLLTRARHAPLPPGIQPEEAAHCRSVYLNHLGDHEATAEFYCGPISVMLRQRDGSQVPMEQAPPPLLSKINEVPFALHFVEFASVPFRFLYVILTLAGCAAILTGNWLWIERRPPSRGTWLLQRLTLATVAGSLLASAAMLVANRCAISARFEQQVFWYTWLTISLACFVDPRAERLWRSTLNAAGVLFVVTPLASVAPLGAANWWALPVSNRVVDVTLLGLGVLCFLLQRGIQRSKQRTHHTQGWKESRNVA